MVVPRYRDIKLISTDIYYLYVQKKKKEGIDIY